MDRELKIRNQKRFESINEQKKEPSEEFISKLQEMILSLPTQNDDEIIDTINAIQIFICHYKFDFYRSISPEELQNILNLIPFQPMRKNSEISYHSIDIFTLLLKNDPSLLELYLQQNLLQFLIENLEYIIDTRFYISCISLFNEVLSINSELRDEFLSYNLQDLIMRCIPYPDKIFFQFLTKLTLHPTFSEELAAIIVPSFIAQDVPQERSFVVIECLIDIIQANDAMIMPIMNSDFLERTIPQLGKVIYTISTFFRFCNISLRKIPDAREALMRVNMCSFLEFALKLIEKKEMSFADMLTQALKSDASKSELMPSANEELITQAFSLMSLLINQKCYDQFQWVNGYNFADKFIKGEVPFQAKRAMVDFLLKYLLLSPNTTVSSLINQELIRAIMEIIAISLSSNEPMGELENGYLTALSQLAVKYEAAGVKDIINQLNEEFDLPLNIE